MHVSNETEDVESRIIEAAKKVFVRQGFVRTTMSDIAQEIGIGRTALHYYFRTKEVLFDAIFGQLLDHLLPNIKKVMDQEGTMLDKMPLIIQEYTSVLYDNMLLPIFVVSEVNRDPEHLYQAFFKKTQQIEPLIRMRTQLQEEMDKGIIRKMVLMDLFIAIVSMIVFPLLIRKPLTDVFLDSEEEKFDEYILGRTSRITEIILHLLTPEKTDK
ncbi:TetR/AcrR family transcriptional regulator [Parabacteroides sp. PF5-9]|uniref:TetR/AcrR family transcriptional regulator n=1 Tax=Parabacteroides sp. PF5-9 TaxID=1742404 RepID=UPI002476DE9E|nr:TetR/AcrR family transcriptional regulator [Parabacteroides sp. PF5-9]MDH6358112.1 TetR/AcrR family transcriptional regulator [Parabacteroides sp. PF5-9]